VLKASLTVHETSKNLTRTASVNLLNHTRFYLFSHDFDARFCAQFALPIFLVDGILNHVPKNNIYEKKS